MTHSIYRTITNVLSACPSKSYMGATEVRTRLSRSSGFPHFDPALESLLHPQTYRNPRIKSFTPFYPSVEESLDSCWVGRVGIGMTE